VNQNSFKKLQFGLAEVSRLLLPFAVIWLLGSIGLGWLVKSFFILLALLIVTPVIAFLGFRWWLSRNLVQSQCPVCHQESISLQNTEFNCPNCREPLKVENGVFQRLTPPGTIDVSAVEVPTKSLNN
jgi:hypothetical protein